MTKFYNRALLALMLFHLIAAGLISAQQIPIDSTLYTSYSAPFPTYIMWTVCGSLQNGHGCYGSGSLAPFSKVGAMIEGSPTTQGNVVRRYIYVLDVAAGNSGNEVLLNVFKKTDTIVNSFDTVSVTLFKTTSLPLTGGANATSFIAANDNFLFIGTDQTPFAIEVAKSNLSIQQISVITGANVSSITADQYGYVCVTFGNPSQAFGIWDRTGAPITIGGASQFLADTANGVLPSSIP